MRSFQCQAGLAGQLHFADAMLIRSRSFEVVFVELVMRVGSVFSE